MKIRSGFVSNSSSSSFIVLKNKLTAEQIYDIQQGWEHGDLAHETEWSMSENRTHFRFNTSMDNCDLKHYLCSNMGVDPNAIEWGGY